ncbi:unnamed protein product [Soboliphyme baturini]|uniref:Ras family protein n=1 Tax=Soboliphyme baturini TaxID=241478 RepID=A0A183IZG8_9BILA|nr:unnamed protein product [Soboliphyme baturini]
MNPGKCHYSAGFAEGSSLLMRFVEDRFDESIPSTIGIDYKMKTITVYDQSVRLQLWDTAGLDRYQTLTPSYYRGAQGIILVYDVTDRDSFDQLNNWLDEAQRYCEKKDFVAMLVGNKVDMEKMQSQVVIVRFVIFICRIDETLYFDDNVEEFAKGMVNICNNIDLVKKT